jgi:hypothetical protein
MSDEEDKSEDYNPYFGSSSNNKEQSHMYKASAYFSSQTAPEQIYTPPTDIDEDQSFVDEDLVSQRHQSRYNPSSRGVEGTSLDMKELASLSEQEQSEFKETFSRISEVNNPFKNLKKTESRSGRQDHECLEVVSEVLNAQKVMFRQMLEAIRRKIKELNLNEYDYPLSVGEMIDAASIGILNSFRVRDTSLSLELAESIRAEDKETSGLQVERLNDLFSNFVETATRLGEMIISENHKPQATRMIKPSKIGGIAGGEKFIAK